MPQLNPLLTELSRSQAKRLANILTPLLRRAQQSVTADYLISSARVNSIGRAVDALVYAAVLTCTELLTDLKESAQDFHLGLSVFEDDLRNCCISLVECGAVDDGYLERVRRELIHNGEFL